MQAGPRFRGVPPQKLSTRPIGNSFLLQIAGKVICDCGIGDALGGTSAHVFASTSDRGYSDGRCSTRKIRILGYWAAAISASAFVSSFMGNSMFGLSRRYPDIAYQHVIQRKRIRSFHRHLKRTTGLAGRKYRLQRPSSSASVDFVSPRNVTVRSLPGRPYPRGELEVRAARPCDPPATRAE